MHFHIMASWDVSRENIVSPNVNSETMVTVNLNSFSWLTFREAIHCYSNMNTVPGAKLTNCDDTVYTARQIEINVNANITIKI